MKRYFTNLVLALTVFTWLTTNIARGATTWTGTAENADWFDNGNWSDGAPGVGEDAIIGTGASILLTNQTAQIGTLTMSGGTLTFSNWYARISAINITLSDGTVTLPPAFTNNDMSNRVWLVSSGDFTLGENAIIDVDGKGYARGIPLADGNGPGGGHSCSYGSGAGHGGRGGFQGNAVSMVGHTFVTPLRLISYDLILNKFL